MIGIKRTLYPDTKTTPEDRRFPFENSTELLRLRTNKFYLGFGFNRPSWPSAPVSLIFHIGLKDYMHPFPPCYSVGLHLRLFKWEALSFSGVIQYSFHYSVWTGSLNLCFLGAILRLEYSPKLAVIRGI